MSLINHEQSVVLMAVMKRAGLDQSKIWKVVRSTMVFESDLGLCFRLYFIIVDKELERVRGHMTTRGVYHSSM